MALVIGIDLGERTGFAAIDAGKLIHKGSCLLKGVYGQCLLALEDYLREFIHLVRMGRFHDGTYDDYVDKYPIDLVLIEEPPCVKNHSVYNQLSGYEAICIKLCEQMRIPYLSENNATIKKVICRGGAVGKTDKDDMLRVACELIGQPIPTGFKTKKARTEIQDEYDAVLCAYYGQYLLDKEVSDG